MKKSNLYNEKTVKIHSVQDTPYFCFKYLQEHSIKDCKDSNILRDFLFRLQKISSLGWKQILSSNRHFFGMEKIKRQTIKHDLPPDITPDITLLAFRATGNNLPFVGFREDNVFYILFIETAFGDIYSHNT